LRKLKLNTPRDNLPLETRKVELVEVLQDLLAMNLRNVWTNKNKSPNTVRSNMFQPGGYTYSHRSESSGRPTSTTTEYKQALNESFTSAINTTKLIYHRGLVKPFCPPQLFSFGMHFRNKSEQDRYNKVANEVLSLRYLLKNDTDISAVYVTKFLKAHLSQKELDKMTEVNISNLLDAILNSKDFNPCLTMREFVLKALEGKMEEIEGKEEPDFKNKTANCNTLFDKSDKSTLNSTLKKPHTIEKPVREMRKALNKSDFFISKMADESDRLEENLDIYIKSQDVHNVSDINFPSLRKPLIEGYRPITSIIQEERDNGFDKLTVEEDRRSIMKRNRLLLEHIMKNRAKDKKSIETSITFYNSSKNKDTGLINSELTA